MNIADIHSDGRYGKVQQFREVLPSWKYSTLITEFSIYKLSGDLQRMDVRRYTGVLEASLLRTQILSISSTKSLICTLEWKLPMKSKFFVKIHFAKIFNIL